MKNKIDWKEIVLQWLDGIPNEQLMKMSEVKTLPKLYHHLRGFLFAVAKENPIEMKKLVEKSTGKWNKKIMETANERLQLQIDVVDNLLADKSLVEVAKMLKISYPKAKKLFYEFISRDDYPKDIPYGESVSFILANYRKELKQRTIKLGGTL